MNLICNNCGGADVYRLLGKEYNNPFIWCATFAEDFINLINNYKNTDFNNFELTRLTAAAAGAAFYEFDDKKCICGITVDNKFTIYYTHYCYSPLYSIPTKIGPDIWYNKNFEYVYEKYIDRKDKMLKENEEPIFFIIAFQRHGWIKENIEKLLQIKTNYKICLITDMLVNSKDINKKIIYEPKLEQLKFPLDVIKKHFINIQSFLYEKI